MRGPLIFARAWQPSGGDTFLCLRACGEAGGDLARPARAVGSITEQLNNPATDAQLQNLEDGLKAQCSDAHVDIISAHDEFGHFQRQPAQVRFDSRGNFEKNCQGNSFYYDRR